MDDLGGKISRKNLSSGYCANIHGGRSLNTHDVPPIPMLTVAKRIMTRHVLTTPRPLAMLSLTAYESNTGLDPHPLPAQSS